VAVAAGQLEVANVLLSRGADPSRPNADGETPFDVAERAAAVAAFELLAQYAAKREAEAGLADAEDAEARAAAEMAASELAHLEAAEAEDQAAEETYLLRTAELRAESERLIASLGISRPTVA
jgi:ankyrin repeat protein